MPPMTGARFNALAVDR